MFLDSVEAARDRYRTALQRLRGRTLQLANTDFDTGEAPVRGRNAQADETFADLLHKLAGRQFAGVSPELRRHLNEHFAVDALPARAVSADDYQRLRVELVALNQR